MKMCQKCKNWKESKEFHKRSAAKDGLFSYCKMCKSEIDKNYIETTPNAKEKRKKRSREWRKENPDRANELVRKWKANNIERTRLLDKSSHLWTAYRLTMEKYIEICNSQGNVCAICKEHKRLYVDHDHSCCPENVTCGKCVRGLVCQKCNTFLHFVDSGYYEKYSEAIKAHVSITNKEIIDPIE